MSNNLQEEKLKRFKEMGIPIPMTPLSASDIQVPVKNLNFAAKLAALKSGQKKDVVENFISKERATKEFAGAIPVVAPKNKNKNQPPNTNAPKVDVPPLANFGSTAGGDFSIYEKTLLGEDNKAQADIRNVRAIQDGGMSDETGSQFLNEFRGKLQEKLANKATTVNNTEIPSGYSLINEEELKKKIISISSQVAKSVMTKVLNEYAASKKTIVESAKVKKAEIVGNNVVKIDGKLFNITPVK